MGCRVPVSWFASCTVTRRVSACRALASDGGRCCPCRPPRAARPHGRVRQASARAPRPMGAPRGWPGCGRAWCRPGPERRVVGLGGAAGEDDFIGVGVEQVGDCLAGILEGLAGAAAEAMGAGRVAERFAGKRLHRLHHGRQQRRGCIVVQVDQVLIHWLRRIGGLPMPARLLVFYCVPPGDARRACALDQRRHVVLLDSVLVSAMVGIFEKKSGTEKATKPVRRGFSAGAETMGSLLSGELAHEQRTFCP